LGRWLASIALRAKKGGRGTGGLDDEQRGMLNLLMEMGLWPDRKPLLLSHEKEERENVQLVVQAASRTTKSRGGGVHNERSVSQEDNRDETKVNDSAASLTTLVTSIASNSSSAAATSTSSSAATTSTSSSALFSFANRTVLSPAPASSFVPDCKPVYRPIPGGKQAVPTEESVAALTKRHDKLKKSGGVKHVLLGNAAGPSTRQSSSPVAISPTGSVTAQPGAVHSVSPVHSKFAISVVPLTGVSSQAK
jgi:hypothetical protein